MTTKKTTYFLLLTILAVACRPSDKSDAYGHFEATTVLVSAKGNGQLVYFDVTEGQKLSANQIVGLIDTTQQYLEKQKLKAQLGALEEKLKDAGPEIAVLKEKLANLTRERNRTSALLEKKAATQKQLDDLNGDLDVVNQQINTTEREIAIANRGILSEKSPIKAQVDILDHMIHEHQVISPISGTVLTKLAEASELVATGTPLFKLADLERLRLRAYTSANLLTRVSLGDEVRVLVDDGAQRYRELPGRVEWIAAEAEFTPKTIETKEERVNLVYALDISVDNDGTLKIGMPGEVLFVNAGDL